jgi:hypothetical protein
MGKSGETTRNQADPLSAGPNGRVIFPSDCCKSVAVIRKNFREIRDPYANAWHDDLHDCSHDETFRRPNVNPVMFTIATAGLRWED